MFVVFGLVFVLGFISEEEFLMSLKRSINLSSVKSRYFFSGMSFKLTFMMRVRFSFFIL